MSREAALLLHTNITELIATLRRYHAMVSDKGKTGITPNQFLEVVKGDVVEAQYATAWCNPQTFSLSGYDLKNPEIAQSAVVLATAYLDREKPPHRRWTEATPQHLCELERLADALGKTLGLDAPVARPVEPIRASQADIARAMKVSPNTSGLLKKLQKEGILEFSPVGDRKNQFNIIFRNPGEHERVRQAI